MQQQPIHFARASDGVTIAYTTLGTGPPLLIAPGWITHLELEKEDPDWRAFAERLSAGGSRRVVRWDNRGSGLSDREVSDTSAAARALDIAAVVESMAADKVAIFAWSMGGPAAIIYAAAYPEKVSHLILYATFARFQESGREAVGKALVDLIRADWRIGSRAIVEFISPGADKELADHITTYLRHAASGEVAAAMLEEAFFSVDVRELLPRLTMPTLVMHRRDDQAFSMSGGRELASLMPHAHFVPLPGNVHSPFGGDASAIVDAVNDFLAAGDHHAPVAIEEPHEHVHAGPTGGLQTILFTDMEESTGTTQRLGDAGAQEMVRAHNTIVREALHNHGGAEIKHTGDGIMASFPSAARAVEAAIAIQKACDDHAVNHPTTPIRLRIGLNAGEPVAEEQDLFGAAVQMTSRICSSAAPGQILVSNVVRELSMGKGFLFSDRGDAALRGFDDPVRLYEVKWRS